jgi:hypothetical protein
MATQNIFNLTDTWNNVATTFTAIKMNATDTASAAGSLLFDLQIASVSVFNVSKNGAVQVSARSAIRSPSDGVFTITNAANSDFGRLQFGGTTSSFPALKRSGVGLQARLADDSAFAAFFCGDIVANNRLYLGPSASQIIIPSDGVFRFTNSTETDLTRVQLGGSTNSFGAIARDGAGISIVGAAGGSTAHIKVPGVTVANLPAAATAGAGARAFVTDALAPVFGSAVAGSGAVNVPVYSDGAAWNVG